MRFVGNVTLYRFTGAALLNAKKKEKIKTGVLFGGTGDSENIDSCGVDAVA